MQPLRLLSVLESLRHLKALGWSLTKALCNLAAARDWGRSIATPSHLFPPSNSDSGLRMSGTRHPGNNRVENTRQWIVPRPLTEVLEYRA